MKEKVCMDALIAHLHKECEVTRKLVEHYQHFQSAIIGYNLNAVIETAQTLRELTDQLESLEQQRLALMEAVLHLPRSTVRHYTITDLLSEAEMPHHKQQLLQLSERFKILTDRLERTITVNQFLIRRALHFTDYLLELLTGHERSLYNLRA